MLAIAGCALAVPKAAKLTVVNLGHLEHIPHPTLLL